MLVPLTTDDFLTRGATVYPDRIAVIDEPNQPAGTLGALTFAELQARARAISAGLDAMGVGAGERIAVVSPNAARMLELFYGATATGRIVVPVNFRLKRDEVAYIVEHSGASLLLVDPELDEPLADVRAPRRLMLGRDSDEALLRFGREPRPWDHVDENATATINYTSGTTVRPKGVELTHRNLWLNATVMALHLGITDQDVYLHTVPMFHANGWSLPFALAGLGVPQIVMRRVDGAEVLRRVERHDVTLCGGAPAVLDIAMGAAAAWPRPRPRRLRRRRRRAAAGGREQPDRRRRRGPARGRGRCVGHRHDGIPDRRCGRARARLHRVDVARDRRGRKRHDPARRAGRGLRARHARRRRAGRAQPAGRRRTGTAHQTRPRARGRSGRGVALSGVTDLNSRRGCRGAPLPAQPLRTRREPRAPHRPSPGSSPGISRRRARKGTSRGSAGADC